MPYDQAREKKQERERVVTPTPGRVGRRIPQERSSAIERMGTAVLKINGSDDGSNDNETQET